MFNIIGGISYLTTKLGAIMGKGYFPIVPTPLRCNPQLKSTCLYMVNYYVKILHVRLRVANNMHPLRGGGGGTEGKDPGKEAILVRHF